MLSNPLLNHWHIWVPQNSDIWKKKEKKKKRQKTRKHVISSSQWWQTLTEYIQYDCILATTYISYDCYTEKWTKPAVWFNISLQCLTTFSNLNVCLLPFRNATKLTSHPFYIINRKAKKEKRKIACNAKPSEAWHHFFWTAAPRFVFTTKLHCIITLICCFWLKYHYTHRKPQWKAVVLLNESSQKSRT